MPSLVLTGRIGSSALARAYSSIANWWFRSGPSLVIV